jgi:hypothetical protein
VILLPTIADAMSYLELKWSIIPCKPDKRPYCQWTKFQTTPATEEEIRSWWTKWPEANIAAITGQVSQFVAVDIDSEIGLMAYKAQFGEVHNTVSQTTGKIGARHLLFKPPAGVKLANSTRGLPDVDVRGDGGYIIIPPSVHLSGRKYTWSIDPRESLDDLLDLPPDVMSWFWPGIKEAPVEKKERLDVQALLLGVKKGQRNDVCARLAGYYLRITRGDVEQTRAVLELWNQRNDPPLDWKEISRTVESISKRQGREELGESAGGTLIERIEKLIYPDGDVKYNIYVTNYDGYAQMVPKDLVNQTRFREKFMMLTDILISPIKTKEWASLVSKALQESTKIKIDPEETTLGAIRRVIVDGTKPERATDDIGMINTHVVCKNGSALFTMDHIQNVLQFSGTKITSKEIGGLLRRMGCTRVDLDKRDTHCRIWQIKKDVINGI